MNKNLLRNFIRKTWAWAWRTSLWRRGMTILVSIVIISLGVMYGIAEWYIHAHANEPVTLGATFIPDYAQQLGVDPKATLQAILEPQSQGGLGMKHIRLVSYWNDIEPAPGKYSFSKLDWQFAMADKYGAKVSLALGLRQPRWPECHEPSWAASEPASQWEPQLDNFITAVINRYKNNPALESYQLENEFFMKIFGQCSNYDRNRLIAEAKLVKADDPSHSLIISRSDNWIGIPVRSPTPDEFGISVYKRVWDYHFTKRYVEYPLPPWYYAFLAGLTQIVTHKNTMIHELQAEPWLPGDLQISQNTLPEQAKSFSPQYLKDRVQYAEDTGLKTIELWGVEYWYWMKVANSDPSYWQVAQQSISQARSTSPSN